MSKGHYPRPSIAQRLMKHSVPVTETGCWLYTGKWKSNGYGVIRTGDRSTANAKEYGAHRAAYTAFKGAIPDGLVVRHKCDTRCCVNPDHLELGTYADNNRDTAERSRIGVAPTIPAGVVRYIRTAHLSVADLAKSLGMKYGTVWAIKNQKVRRRG